MKSLIRRILREEMISFIDNWVENFTSPDKGVVATLISKDDVTNDKLYLFVGFVEGDNFSEYTYSFILLDPDNNPLTDYLTRRNEVINYIPYDIKNKRLLFPIIKDMTRRLMDQHLPQNIVRRTVEPLSGDSLIRYEEITNIMINEYGYRLDNVVKDKFGYTTWNLTKVGETENNIEMNESYEIVHRYSIQELQHIAFDWVLPLLPKDL
jgi:hypothetical protein